MLPQSLVTVRPPALAWPGDPDGADRWRGGPATDGVAPASQTVAGTPSVTGPLALARGDCCAWPLPADATCAAVARDVFAEAAGLLGLPGELRLDGVAMASELAANTLHAGVAEEFNGAGRRPPACPPELWVYLRRAAAHWELVCKVFDSLGGWKNDQVPAAGGAEPDAVGGRGLGIVAALSAGRWGHHLTRSRLDSSRVPGKAVWFAQEVPGTCVPGPLRGSQLPPAQAARALEEMLTERGLGDGLLRVQEPSAEMALLSVRYGLTVWCRGSVIWWWTPDGRREQRVPTDLVDVAEQVVGLSAEMDRGSDSRYPGLERVR
jgi:hypothetical protein